MRSPAEAWEFEAAASMSLLVLFSSLRKAHFFLLWQRRECMLFFTERKASKELQAYRLTVCAAGSGSMAAIKDGLHAREARVIRQSPPFSATSYRKALIRRAPCACGRELPTRSCVPHGEWWPVRALRALQHLSSRGYALPGRSMGV